MAIPRLQSGVSVAKEITERWIAKHPRNDDGDIELAAFGTLVDAINDVCNSHTREALAAVADEIADCFEDEEHYLEVRAVILKLQENYNKE